MKTNAVLQKKMVFFFFLLISVFSYSQVKISGKVTHKNKPLKDIAVTLKDTYDGATTDAEGNFSFETAETGSHHLTFTHPKYIEVDIPISITGENIEQNAALEEELNEINAVVISAGVAESSDKKRGTSLTPIDVYTTAGSDAQISSALNFRPGVQKVGESEGLFVRGGSGTETKVFMDGTLVNNFYTNSVPGVAGRDRFNTSLFKGNIFSTGGYSALYGQALSGALILESIDLPEQSSYDFGVSPLFISGGMQKLSNSKTYSFGASFAYFNLALIQKLLKYNQEFSKAPVGIGGDANFRIKNKAGGIFKYYGSFDTSKMGIISPSLEDDYEESEVKLDAGNMFHNFSFRQKFGKYSVNAGTSFSNNNSDLHFASIDNGIATPRFDFNTKEKYFNFKTVVEKKIRKISAIRGGVEFNNARETNNFNKNYKDLISSAFVETDLGLSNDLSAKIGLRAENSSYLGKTNFAPRLALGYRLSENWTSSLAYGIFYQNPESKYLNSNAPLTFQKAQHYIAQVQRVSEGRLLRAEVFYKNYDRLIKTTGDEFFQTAQNNDGNGVAKGAEIFWKDNKTFKSFEYWVSYSYLDTERNSLNFPVSLTPGFAAKNTFSVVAKKFIPKLKTGFNASYLYSSGRPFYDIVTENGQNIIRHQGTLKDYNSLNLSINYLPNLGKKDAKAFSVIVFSISNILNSKNVYGYNFSADGTRSNPILPPSNLTFFLGAFISFGVDKTNDAINNNL